MMAEWPVDAPGMVLLVQVPSHHCGDCHDTWQADCLEERHCGPLSILADLWRLAFTAADPSVCCNSMLRLRAFVAE